MFVGVCVGVCVGVFVGVCVGVFVGVCVGVLVAVCVGVLVAVAVGVFVGVFVAVAVAVDVCVGVFVGVFVGVPVGVPHTLRVPMIWNIWSGALPPTQAVFNTQSLLEHIKAPPGLRNAAPLLDCNVRSVHPHWPFGVKFMFACTDIQYVPPPSTQLDGR